MTAQSTNKASTLIEAVLPGMLMTFTPDNFRNTAFNGIIKMISRATPVSVCKNAPITMIKGSLLEAMRISSIRILVFAAAANTL
jgi:hypothetical protein